MEQTNTAGTNDTQREDAEGGVPTEPTTACSPSVPPHELFERFADDTYVFCLAKVFRSGGTPTLSSGVPMLHIKYGERPQSITSWPLAHCYQADLYVRSSLLHGAERRAEAAEARVAVLVGAARALSSDPENHDLRAALALVVDPPPVEDDVW